PHLSGLCAGVRGSERRLVGDPTGRAGRRTTSPWVVAGGVAAGRVPRGGGGAGGLGDGGGGPLQRGTDLGDVPFEHGALLALAGVVGALPQHAGDHDPGTAGEGVGEVFRGLAP